MKRIAFALAGLALAAAAAQAQVSVTDPWVRATVAQQKATGLFMQLDAVQDVRLVAGESPVAGVVEIHEMAMDGDVMRMRAIAGLALPAGRPVELKPGGYHVMLMDLKRPLAGGETVPLTLVFENAAGQRVRQEVQAKVMALGAQPGAMGAGPQGGHRH